MSRVIEDMKLLFCTLKYRFCMTSSNSYFTVPYKLQNCKLVIANSSAYILVIQLYHTDFKILNKFVQIVLYL
jgi:hypothetical protein